MKKIGMISCLLFCVFFVQAEEKQVLIIYPLESSLTDKVLPQVAGAAVEQSLLKTGRYVIINHRDFELLLQAQGLMFSGFFDETQVISIGRMLPAELIARGSLTRSGETLTINLKILDLQSGTVLAAEGAQGVMPSELGGTIRQLVFRLCGLPSPKPAGGAALQAALTVTSEPKGAKVQVDGLEYGITPLVLDNLPPGPYFVELSKGSLYYAQQIQLERNAVFYGVLRQRLGNLIITSEPADARVTVGDTGYGTLSFVADLPAENQVVTLRRPGYYWRGEVPILSGRTVQIDVSLEPTALVRITADKQVLCSFYGETVSAEFPGGGEIPDLPPGRYTLECSRAGYELFKQQVQVGSGDVLELSPQLRLSEDVLALQKQWRTELQALVAERDLLPLPGLYLQADVPAMDSLMIKNTFIALCPGLDFLIFLDTPALPAEQLSSLKVTRTVQFATGLLFQAALAGFFLLEDTTLQTAGLLTAVAAGGANLGLGIVAGSRWRGWTRENRGWKARYAELLRAEAELSKLLAED